MKNESLNTAYPHLRWTAMRLIRVVLGGTATPEGQREAFERGYDLYGAILRADPAVAATRVPGEE